MSRLARQCLDLHDAVRDLGYLDFEQFRDQCGMGA